MSAFTRSRTRRLPFTGTSVLTMASLTISQRLQHFRRTVDTCCAQGITSSRAWRMSAIRLMQCPAERLRMAAFNSRMFRSRSWALAAIPALRQAPTTWCRSRASSSRRSWCSTATTRLIRFATLRILKTATRCPSRLARHGTSRRARQRPMRTSARLAKAERLRLPTRRRSLKARTSLPSGRRRR